MAQKLHPHTGMGHTIMVTAALVPVATTTKDREHMTWEIFFHLVQTTLISAAVGLAAGIILALVVFAIALPFGVAYWIYDQYWPR